MKTLAAIGLCVWVCLEAQAADFKEANARYDAGEYAQAVGLYQQALEKDGPSTALVYNIGNAYYRLGERARSLAYYERALALSPRDPDIRWNADILKSVFVDRIDDANEFILITGVKQRVGYLSFDEISLAISLCLFLYFGVSVVAYFWPRPSFVRRTAKSMLGILFIVLAGMALVKWWEVKDPRVVVTDKEIYARHGPSSKEPKAALLHEGAQGRVVDTSRDWVYVMLANRSGGWIPRSACEII